MTIALLTLSDRADLLDGTMRSLARALERDEGDVLAAFACHVHVDDTQHRLGFTGAIRAGWNRLRASSDAFEYVLHLEDDWRFDAPLELAAMTRILEIRRQQAQPPPDGVSAPDLAQIALLRQPVAGAEIKAGGVLELWPNEFTQTMHGDPADGLTYLEHDLFFTTNPSVYRRDLLELGWPDSTRSEEAFTARCRAAGYRFAYYGRWGDPPRVWHTGNDRREGNGY